jgi:hypothetical protein
MMADCHSVFGIRECLAACLRRRAVFRFGQGQLMLDEGLKGGGSFRAKKGKKGEEGQKVLPSFCPSSPFLPFFAFDEPSEPADCPKLELTPRSWSAPPGLGQRPRASDKVARRKADRISQKPSALLSRLRIHRCSRVNQRRANNSTTGKDCE